MLIRVRWVRRGEYGLYSDRSANCGGWVCHEQTQGGPCLLGMDAGATLAGAAKGEGSETAVVVGYARTVEQTRGHTGRGRGELK
jgi:hypothetical protein